MFFDVAYQSYLPALVGREHLVEGNAKLTGSAQVAAQSPARASPAASSRLSADSYAVAPRRGQLPGLRCRRRGHPARGADAHGAEGGHPQLLNDVGEGLRFVFGDPLLRAITATTATANLFSGDRRRRRDRLPRHGGPRSARPSSACSSPWAASGACSRRSRRPVVARRVGGARATLIIGFAGNAGGLLLPLATPGSRSPLLRRRALPHSGSAAVVYNINQVSFRQRLCPDRMLGRMNATIRFVVWGSFRSGPSSEGCSAPSIGLRPTLWIAAAGESLAGIWLLASPVRRMRDFPAGRSE